MAEGTTSTARSRSHHHDTVTHTSQNIDDGDDKAAKVSSMQSKRVRQLAWMFLVFLAVALIVGSSQEHPPHATPKASAPQYVGPSEEVLQAKVDEWDAKVRAHKAKPKMIMEKDSEGLKLTKSLQEATHRLIIKRYGRHTFRVRVDLIFPRVITQEDGKPAEDFLILEMAPIDLIPCSVYNFLEIARTWKSGAFHRNAGHVLQVAAHSDVTKSMPFQEYSPEYPHRKYTTGYAGRPSGPGWYVSIQDNTQNHGPGSQQKHNPYEADSNFGRVVRGIEDVLPRIHSTPQQGWLDDPNKIKIPKMTILIPDPSAQGPNKPWVPWKPKTTDSGQVKVQ